MKENEAPEKLYVDTKDRLGDTVLFGFTKNEKLDDIEYTRTDVFIKRAKAAFCKAVCNGCPPRSTCTSLGTCERYDNFIKYMKGE